jgi:hypothetical protein
MSAQDVDLPYRIEVWDQQNSHVEELIALVGDYVVARIAFEEAIRLRPGRNIRNITLRQKTRVLAERKGTAADKES